MRHLALASLLLLAGTLSAEAVAQAVPKLDKPIAMVYLTGNANAAIYLIRSPFFAEIEGKKLIVGTGSSWHKDNWQTDLDIWIDWSSVQSVIQFDSVEQAMERLKAPR